MTTTEMTLLRRRDRPSLWFLHTTLPAVTRARVTVLDWLLRLATAGAFIGHGAYAAVMAKAGWYGLFDELGVAQTSVDAQHLLRWVGGVEMALGLLALVFPIRVLLLVMVGWKLGMEFTWYPLHELPAFEFVERWANYTAPLALLLVRGWPRTLRDWFR
jgi:hypothetical protein